MPPPPPGGPRDWSPPDVDARPRPPVRPGRRPIRGGGHIEGIAWARVLAWAGLGLGLATVVLAIILPLVGDLSRPVGIAFFASFAIWFGLMAEPRFRGIRGRGSAVSKTGIGLGLAAFGVVAYAVTAIVLAGYGTRIPAPSHWLSPSMTGVAIDAGPIGAPVAPSAGSMSPESPIESERLALGQSVGTAVYLLEQTRSPDAAWPHSLAVTTDATTLISPDGVSLAPLPPGTQVLYSTSSDRMQFSLTLMGPLGAVATYDSMTRTISSSVS